MKEHIVMIFIGNGFDISVLKKYGKGITTSYESFYSFFKHKYPNKTNNLLIQQMEKAKSEEKIIGVISSRSSTKLYLFFLILKKNK